MNRILAISFSLLLAASAGAFADENLPHDRQPGSITHHYLVTAAHVLSEQEQAQLDADGVTVQHVLPQQRYLVATASAAVT